MFYNVSIMKTIFEKIIDREIPADIVYETDSVIAFKDINPIAPEHILVVPKERITSLHELHSIEHKDLLMDLMQAIQRVAEQQGLMPDGYRVITNINSHGGQTVYHLHFHVLGGRMLSWEA